jgi:hypothetical protein
MAMTVLWYCPGLTGNTIDSNNSKFTMAHRLQLAGHLPVGTFKSSDVLFSLERFFAWPSCQVLDFAEY